MPIEFSELGLKPQIVQNVAELGYVNPTPIQAKVIPIILEGHDVIAQSQTGTGKTAAFILPIIQNLKQGQRKVQALVLAPTRELAQQVAKASEEYGSGLLVRVLAVYGGSPYSRQISALRQGVEIVAGTPGRLLDLIEKKELDLSSVSTVVLDEADEMLSMGFIDDIKEILSKMPAERQTALFSATISPEISGIAKKYMRTPQSVVIKSQHLTVDAIDHRYCLVNNRDKLAVLTRLFEIQDITSALIFVKTRIGTSELVNELMARGFPAEALNGDLRQETREQVLNRFRNNQTTVLVATDMAARGLDIDDISHVFNYDLPEDPELYVHRVGRTARAGKTGIAISLLAANELWRMRRIEGFTKQPITRMQVPTVEEIEKHREIQLQEKVLSWLQSSDYAAEKQLVSRLMAMGHEPLQIAAAAINMARGNEKLRPIAQISVVKEEQSSKNSRDRRSPVYNRRSGTETRGEDRPRTRAAGSSLRAEQTGKDAGEAKRDPSSNRARGSRDFSEKGMVRCTLNAGRAQGVQPADIVGTIAFHANIPGDAIGKITIQDKVTLVDLPEKYVAQALAKNGKYKIRKSPITLSAETRPQGETLRGHADNAG